jgi:hypothetical protein
VSLERRHGCKIAVFDRRLSFDFRVCSRRLNSRAIYKDCNGSNRFLI